MTQVLGIERMPLGQLAHLMDACLADHLTADIILYAVRKRIIS